MTPWNTFKTKVVLSTFCMLIVYFNKNQFYISKCQKLNNLYDTY